MNKEPRQLRIGVLGCGPISQEADFEACRKARNAELYAICDVAEDLITGMAAVHEPRVTYLPGIAFAHRFIREEMGQLLALKAWYCDSTYRFEEMGGV
jgi:hypothetical protein